VVAVCCATIGCGPENNNLNVYTIGGKYVTGSTKPQTAPIKGGEVAGVWDYDISNNNPLVGNVTSFTGTTTDTGFTIANVRMPAEWTISWLNTPSFCRDQGSITQNLPTPWVTDWDLEPSNSPINVSVQLFCYTNDPGHPNFKYDNVSPQFSLDDALPSSLWVASLDAIPSGGTTQLNVYDMSLNNVATMTATSVSPNNMGANFPYPTGASALPAGVYITTITHDDGVNPLTTHGMEPFYIAHDDTSFHSAYGVAVASPMKVTTVTSMIRTHGSCIPDDDDDTTVDGGTPLPLVTLINDGLLAIGSSANTVAVGTHPTVVIPFNDHPQSTVFHPVNCSPIIVTDYSGAQSALVVNTGSNSVSVVKVGQYTYPSGTVAVGNQPVAAAINSAETMAYIANYQDGTISEVDLQNLLQTRVLSVMAHPTSVTFDSSGNLWIGGQGSISKVNLSSWTVASSSPVDGTVNGMAFDTASGVLLHSILQNGSATSPSAGNTGSSAVTFSTTAQLSYAAQSSFNVSTGATVVSPALGDNSSYTQSAIASSLAFPAQTAVSPPVYSSTTGDITATVSGNTFTVSVVDTGQLLIQGTLPYPARGVALAPTMLYFTMPDSNSLLSIPIILPQ
jgi:hypothetical protein